MSSSSCSKFNPAKRLIFWGILLILPFVLACSILELVLRLVDPVGRVQLVLLLGIQPQSNYEEDEKLGYRPRDPLYFWDDREHPPSEGKPVGAVRVFALGDSFVKAHGHIGLENSFYRIAAHLLSEQPDAPNYEWFHFGVSGYCERQHLELIRRYGPPLHPDIIIVQVYLGNDVGENSGIIVRKLQAKGDSLAISDIYRVPRHGTTSPSPLEVLTKRSYFARFLVERLTNLGLELGMPQYSVIPGGVTTNHTLDLMRLSSPPYIEQAWRITEDLVAEIKQESETLNAWLLFVLIPKELQVNEAVSERVTRNLHVNPAEYDFEQPNRRFTDILVRHEIEYVDASPLFRKKIANGEALYDGHFNKEGHRVVGLAVHELLVEKGLPP